MELLTLKEVVTVPKHSFKREDLVKGNLGWRFYKGRGFNKIEDELYNNIIYCPSHIRRIFILEEDIKDIRFFDYIKQPSYPTVEQVTASFISRINMWAGCKNSKHGLLTNGRLNIEMAQISSGKIVAISCTFSDSKPFLRLREINGRSNWFRASHISLEGIVS